MFRIIVPFIIAFAACAGAHPVDHDVACTDGVPMDDVDTIDDEYTPSDTAGDTGEVDSDPPPVTPVCGKEPFIFDGGTQNEWTSYSYPEISIPSTYQIPRDRTTWSVRGYLGSLAGDVCDQGYVVPRAFMFIKGYPDDMTLPATAMAEITIGTSSDIVLCDISDAPDRAPFYRCYPNFFPVAFVDKNVITDFMIEMDGLPAGLPPLTVLSLEFCMYWEDVATGGSNTSYGVPIDFCTNTEVTMY